MSLWTERLVGLLQLVVLISAMTYIGYRWGRYIAALSGAITAIVIIPPDRRDGPGLGRRHRLRAVVGRPSPPGRSTPGATATAALLVAGLLAGAALLFRPDLVLCLGLSLGVLFLLGPRRAPAAKRLALGAGLGVSPYLVHLALAGPGNAIRGMVLEPVFDLRSGRRLPFPPPRDEYTSFLNRAFAFREFPWPLPAPEQPMQIFLFFCSGVRRRGPAGGDRRVGQADGQPARMAARRARRCSPSACCPRPCSAPTRPTCRG